MRKFVFLALVAVSISLMGNSASAEAILLTDLFGGTFQDAEKSPASGDDDLLCWAATASNMLDWSGWGDVFATGPNAEDDIFGHFQDHWSDELGNTYFGVKWWFDGTNGKQGQAGWAQIDVAGGGDFYSTDDFNDNYFYSSDDAAALTTIDNHVNEGRGIGLGVQGPGGHSITCWGYEVDANGDYLGIYVTDSDDDKGTTTPPDILAYYDVDLVGGQWFLQDFYGSDNWYISEVQGLNRRVPEPATGFLLGLGLLMLIGLKRRKRS